MCDLLSQYYLGFRPLPLKGEHPSYTGDSGNVSYTCGYKYPSNNPILNLEIPGNMVLSVIGVGYQSKAIFIFLWELH